MTVWINKKVIPNFNVDKNGGYGILIVMWINKLNEYDIKVDCEDTSCSVRYSKNGETLGILRFVYIKGWGRKFKQDILMIVNMSVRPLIGDLMANNDIPPEMDQEITLMIRTNATNKVRETLNNMGDK